MLIGGGIFPEMESGGIVNTSIQSAPELIQELAKFERKGQHPVALNWGDQKLPCPVVIYIGARNISTLFVETIPEFCQSLSVNLCPCDTVPTCPEW
jgi:hypothetical protein